MEDTQLDLPPTIKLIKKIGEGMYGKVYEGTFTDKRDNSTKDVAIKIINLDKLNESKIENQRKEVAMLQKLMKASKNDEDVPVVKVFSHVETKHNLYIIMEKLEGDGFLFQSLIEKLKKENDWNQIYDLFLKNTIKLLEYLNLIHSYCIIHRDIKPQNLLFNPISNTLKFTDFGLSCFYKTCKGLAGTPNYIDPVCLLDFKFKEAVVYENEVLICKLNERSDIFSLGMTLYTLLTGLTLSKNKMFKTSAEYKSMLENVHVELNNIALAHPNFNTIITCIEHMISLSPKDRPSPKQLIKYLLTGEESHLEKYINYMKC